MALAVRAPAPLLFTDSLVQRASAGPSRMAPKHGLKFLLLGAALLRLDDRKRRGWRPSAAFTIVGVVGVVG
jgi:hypothetical protein